MTLYDDLVPAIRICKHCIVIKDTQDHGGICPNCNGDEEITAYVRPDDAELIESGGIGLPET